MPSAPASRSAVAQNAQATRSTSASGLWAAIRLSWRVRRHAWQARRAAKPRVRRLRLIAIALAVLVLGAISFVFGMFMAVASDLPELEKWQQFKDARNSIVLDDHGHMIAVLSQKNQILLTPRQIPPVVKHAVISIEDKRFYGNEGIDLRSIGRAVLHDIVGGGTQGASTIEEQFVKNALQAQSHRTIFEKLREAALAFQLAHHWSKEKIITEYLNTIYFGNGAYGIEAAAQTYFGQLPAHRGCGTPQRLCVTELSPWEAALLAGMIQSPTEYNPIAHPLAARERRDVVLQQMLQQHYIDRQAYDEGISAPLPSTSQIQPPREQLAEGVDAGYFTSWVDQQVISRYGTLAFDGGLRVKTTLDLDLQRAAERAVNAYLESPDGPTASLVAIENSTGDVRAMVGGRDFESSPFNLATEGERQPGSSFKAFDLAAALEDGISPYSVWTSKVKTFPVPNSSEVFVVHNDEGSYTGTNTLLGATTVSDNSIYAEVGIKVGTGRIARLAHQMGITTPISTNYAMTIGGLKVGVTPLDMAHAYETIAHGGQRISGTMAGERGAPVGIQEVVAPREHTLPNGLHREVNRPRARQVLPPSIAQTETEMLETVITHGTATAAAIGQFAAGKTGTTTNYVDAWFVGFDHKYTVAVWVGYPTGFVPMPTQFNGGPVYGGTFPALIWKGFMLSAIGIEREEAAAKAAARAGKGAGAVSGVSPAASSPVGGAGAATGTGRAGHAGGDGGKYQAAPEGGGSGAAGGGAGPTGGDEHSGVPSGATGTTPQPSSPTPQPSQPPVESPSSSQPPPAASGGEATGGASAPSGGASAGG